MTYEEFKQLAEHPQHRDVPAIFKLEVLETEELEEKKRSHCLLYTSPSPRDGLLSRMPSSA